MRKSQRVTPAPSVTITVNDAVQRYGLSRSRLYVLLGQGHIAGVKAGRRTLIRTDSLDQYLATLPAAVVGETRKAIGSTES